MFVLTFPRCTTCPNPWVAGDQDLIVMSPEEWDEGRGTEGEREGTTGGRGGKRGGGGRGGMSLLHLRQAKMFLPLFRELVRPISPQNRPNLVSISSMLSAI